MKKHNYLMPLCIMAFFSSCSEDFVIDQMNEESTNILSFVERSIYGEEFLIKGHISSKKDEITPTEEIETQASKEVKEAIFTLMRKQMTDLCKTRSEASLLASNQNEMVGVFQVAAPGSGVVIKPSNCGSYREFYYLMDCQDGGFTKILGNVGTTSVDSNGNVHFKFCVVPKGNYGGGVLTFSDWQFNTSENEVNIINVYQDNEDSNNKNNINNAGGLEVIDNRIGPNFFGANTQWFWRYSKAIQKTLPFNYGVLVDGLSYDGEIQMDDENKGNQNKTIITTYKTGVPFPEIFDIRDMASNRYKGIYQASNTTFYIKIK